MMTEPGRKAIEDVENISVTRSQLLAEFQTIVTNDPTLEYHTWAQQMTSILAKMVAEDKTHVRATPADLNQLPTDERVQELIFELRDKNSNELWRFGEQPQTNAVSNTAYEQLIAMGYSAVPQLIQAIDDPELTRSLKVTFHKYGSMPEDSHISHKILNVGDYVVAIFEQIAGRTFKQDTVAGTKAAIEAWWAEFQKIGEKQMLIEGTEAGNGDSPTQAKMLIARYPDAALAALIEGARAADNDYTKVDMLRLFEKYDSPEVVAFLDEVLQAGYSNSQLFAAGMLNRKGRPEGVAMVIQEWEKNQGNSADLPFFLASLDSPEAIVALGKNLQSRPVGDQMKIVEAVGLGGSPWYGGPPVLKRSAAAREAIQELLVTALQDDAMEVGGQRGEYGNGKSFTYFDPRVCDMAGFYLNLNWPESYSFDTPASIKVRDSQRIECQNVWRRAHNLSLLSLPTPTSHVSTNDAAKVMTIKWKTDTVKPSEVFAARIEAFRNNILAATNVVNLLTTYASNPESGTSGLVFEARKDEDLTGVKLFICLLPGTSQNPKDAWNFAEGAVVGQKGIDSRGGGVWATEKRSWEDLARSIDAAVASSPETPFVINVKLNSREH